ncbi:ABC transporter ATP-binding protein [Nesterenkonia ebinurensis]|uniref:ABC transporter ATP-binding protein n=1 Tax=Nesterenkonia ebinurensis TaxID=2608252 RepID=UPI00123D0B2A|nr:ABC transporter ATP-binding protein [Nesterenkonia ebinurensis]
MNAQKVDIDTAVTVRDLSVNYPTDKGILNAVSLVSLNIYSGEILGIVGESGSGKTTVAQGILGLLENDVISGEIDVIGTNVLKAKGSVMRKLRRNYVATILQDPLGSLNPVRTIRSQLRESAAATGTPRGKRDEAIGEVLLDVGLTDSRVLRSYPHQLSGGMNQRVSIAMALLKNPKILIADEPTSALDVRTQAAIMKLLLDIRARRGTSIMMVTHDLELALGSCDRVGVMYAGRLVEIGAPEHLRNNAKHPYTKALLGASPRFGQSERVTPIPGRFTSVLNHPPGCPFRSRCANAIESCAEEFPPASEDLTAYWCWKPVPGGENSQQGATA